MKVVSAYRSVIFLHIPKTAGTTLSRIIERQYPYDAIYTVSTEKSSRTSIQDFLRLSKSQRNRIQCLKGHMPFGLHEHLPQPCTYITLLRDPIERIISHYYFVLRSPHHYLYEQVVSHHMTLDEYVSSGISPELSNKQTGILAGDEEICMLDMLKAAKRNLRDHFAVVGLTERFDESLLLMKNNLGWGNVFYKKRNVTPQRPSRSSISESTIRRIEQSNQQDMELYEFAEHLFEEFCGSA